jgi:catechol 2,3-dioxygenase-like lactoylglutathione lyase family enzyme
MIAHTSINVSNYEKSKKFYQSALKPLGYKLNMEFGKSGGFFDGKNTDFWIMEKEVKNDMHVAFGTHTRKMVDEFYDAAIAAGAKDNGKPGLRPDYGDNYYAAYIFDPDGHNIEAVCFNKK